MTTQYEQLRYSFDNILKELDDICKGIDDIAEKVPESDTTVHTQQDKSTNKLKNFNINSAVLVDQGSSDLVDEYKDLKSRSELTNSVNRSSDQVFLSFDQNSLSYNASIEFVDDGQIEPELINLQGNRQVSPFVSKREVRDRFKKHRLPDSDENSSVNSAIGSAQESLLNKLNVLPLETELKIEKLNYENQQGKDNELHTESNKKLNNNKNENSHLYLKPLSQNNQVSFQIDDDSSENIEAASRYPDNFQRVEEPGDQFFSHSYESPDHDDGVYLNDQEIVKIKCFYSSMGCYVHVSRSIAELYQLKRDDAFEELDNDPVNDYRLYMEKLESKKTEEQLEEDTAEKVAKQRNANYMYINSGVPVIIFNYGANPKRVKDLRVLLVERSTGFCMWQFKYNWLTHFKNSNNITVARVAYAHNTVNKVEESSSTQAANNPTSSTEPGLLSTLSSKLSTTAPSTPNYQNEYFEKFFSCTKVVHKEHLLKFIDKSDCDRFCLRQTNIIELNSEEFMLNTDTTNYSDLNLREDNLTNNELLPAPPPPIDNSDSLIICHFDFYNSSLQASNMSQSLNDLTLNNDLFTTKFVEESDSKFAALRTNMLQKYSISSTNLPNSSSTSIGAIIKRKIFGSNISIEELSKKNATKTKPDTINLKAFKFKFKKLKKSDISAPVDFNHVTHLDKPVPIGRRYKLNYKS